MEHRRLGRIGHQSSVLVYGAASLWSASQAVADASVAEALAAGINHVDTAANYGVSEERLGPALGSARDGLFLATKTQMRTREEAWVEINRSLELLRTDVIDLLQVHAVCDVSELNLVTSPDGPLGALERARDEGMVRWLGITGHTHEAPWVHAEALRRFDFDSVLTPLNYQLMNDPHFAEGYASLVDLIRERDVALRTIKATARRPWQPDERRYATWYAPFDDQRHITAAISWVLSHPEVTAVATAGETTLLARAIEAEAHRMPLDEAVAVLSGVDDYASIF